MTWRATGAGKSRIHDQSANSIKLRLYNFDHDGARLKREHKSALRSKAIPLLVGNRSLKGKLFGYASACGNASYNVRLSRRRLDNVGNYMISHGVELYQMGQMISHGESQSDQRAPNEEWDRAVLVDVAPYQVPSQPQAQSSTPQPSQPPSPIDPAYTRWRIRLKKSLDVVVLGIYRFEIQSAERPQVRQNYKFVGVGASVNFPAVTENGPWNPFRTKRRCYVHEFTGLLQFSAVSLQVGPYGGGASLFELGPFEFLGTGPFGKVVIANFKTGPGFAVSAGSLFSLFGTFYLPAPTSIPQGLPPASQRPLGPFDA